MAEDQSQTNERITAAMDRVLAVAEQELAEMLLQENALTADILQHHMTAGLTALAIKYAVTHKKVGTLVAMFSRHSDKIASHMNDEDLLDLLPTMGS